MLFGSRDAVTASIWKAIFEILKICVGKFISWHSGYLSGYFVFTYSFEDMPGSNCAFFGCGTSRNHGLSMFKIPSLHAENDEHTSTLKREIRDELLRLILRTREMELDFFKNISMRIICICCELHFKPQCILTSKYLFCCLRVFNISWSNV